MVFFPNGGGAVTGTYHVSDGLAGLLARIGGKSTTATATTAQSGLDSQIKDLKTRIDRYDDTLKSKEVLLKAKLGLRSLRWLRRSVAPQRTKLRAPGCLRGGRCNRHCKQCLRWRRFLR